MTQTTLLTLAVALLAAGCSDNRNLRLSLSDDIPLNSFPPKMAEPALDADGNQLPIEPPADDQPTVTGLDRSNFAPITWAVPIDGTSHSLGARSSLARPTDTARQRGEFPTAVSALETGSARSTRGQVYEIALLPVTESIDLVMRAGAGIAGVLHSSTSPQYPVERTPTPADPSRPGVITNQHSPVSAPADSETVPTDPTEAGADG